jgi:hypothetical protein
MCLGATKFRSGALAALVLAFGMAPASASVPPEDVQHDTTGVTQAGDCGKPGRPPCPLQAFMRTRVAAPLASNNTAMLAASLERVATLAPEPAWTSWAAFASRGAAAARNGDVAAARASCKGCHDAWRDAYRRKHRVRPLPQ